ncbi:conserved hypothetical protein (plasmid) [Gloeothece citriformis PCC 7424]|uniref:Uncharacterized protein n=1 Tax=Gloeothece citriformis (strain PCC 7424) TaxID=65393 RepID=B7KMV4_GLOC7|nr:hypothetical protein [Gloeothece citriformis]ACK74126.1 conserved hypothetical protein [Gloeothece citriformis PCC 7424]
MKTPQNFTRFIFLVFSSYFLVGFYLSAHQLLGVMGVYFLVIISAIIFKNIPCLKPIPKQLFAPLGGALLIALMVSVLASLTISWSMLWLFIVIPFLTTLLAVVEMQIAGFSQLMTFLSLTTLAAIGLGAGELIDLVI